MQSQKLVGILVGGIVLGGAVGFGVGMKTGEKRAAGGSSGSSSTCSIGGGTSDVLFELDGKSYARDSLATSAKDTLYQIESQAHDNISSFIKELALRVTLAQEKNPKVKLEELPDLSDLLAGSKPTEPEMRAFFDANKASLPPGTTYEQVKPQLEKFMVSQKIGKEAREKVAALESSGKLKIMVAKPMAPTIAMDWSAYPSRGAASAKVTVVEVSDYLCTHCRDAKPAMEALVKEYGSKVKFVQVDFALRPTGLSGALVRGGFCAKKQGDDKFWKYFDKAFETSMDAAKPVSPDADKEFNGHALTAAKDSGVNIADFENCLTSPEAKTQVDNTNKSLSSIGVSGTPTFFVNNKKVAGGPAAIKEQIEAALK